MDISEKNVKKKKKIFGKKNTENEFQYWPRVWFLQWYQIE